MPLNLTFTDGTPVQAAQMNQIITAINDLENRVAATEGIIESTSKSQLIVVARKTTQLDFVGNGQAQTIGGWAIPSGQPNLDTQLNVTSGIFTANKLASYTIEMKTLVSASNSASPRSKLTLTVDGTEIILDEDTVFETQGNIPNYRRTLKGGATVSLSPGKSFSLQIAVWGATSATIFANINTELRVSRSIV